MKLFLIYLAWFFILPSSLNAQESEIRKHYIHLDIGGPGGFGSIGYARTSAKLSPRCFKTIFGVAVSTFRTDGEQYADYHPLIIPEFSMVFFKKMHHLEFGLAPQVILATGISGGKRKFYGIVLPSYRLGWRLEKPDGRSFLRIGFSCFAFDHYDSGPILIPIWPYLGSGIRF